MTRFRERSSVSSAREAEEGEEHEISRLVPTPEPITITNKMNRFSNQDDNNPSSSRSSQSTVPGSILNMDETIVNPRESSFNVDPRDVFEHCMLSSRPESHKPQNKSLWSGLSKNCKCTPVEWFLTLFPIFVWLPKYNWRKDLTFDLIAGATICVMHIPQGMAYALLGNLQPVVGIYMAFFPIIVYSIMGTSRHISMGTFAVICLMTGKVATERMAGYATNRMNSNGSTLVESSSTGELLVEPYTADQIATVISFAVGIWQVLMGVLKLGSLSVLLSAELVSGFTTGAAVHVLTSQIKNLFGLSLPRINGIFKIPLTYVDIFSNIGSSNVTAIVFSTVTIAFLVIYNELLKPIVSSKIPLPVELLVIVIGTLVSKYWITNEKYGMPIVNHIPTGLPTPSLPPMEILPDVIVDSLIIAIVAYTVSISMAKIFAIKHEYSVSPNQELLANGASNFVGSFFSCAPISASLSRSLIQEQVGGKTQLAGLFSCFILVFVLLWIGPFFETLPHCVLSSMIVVALKGMFMQIHDLPKSYKESPLNAAVWVAAFVSTVVLDIEYGLGIGLILSIFNLIWRSNRPYISVQGVYLGSNIYVDSNYEQAREIPGIKIIKYTGSLNFATSDFFVEKLQNIIPTTNAEPKTAGMLGGMIVSTISREKINDNISVDDNLYGIQPGMMQLQESISFIILDFSSLSSIDPAAIKSLQTLIKIYSKKDIQLLFVGCPPSIIATMDSCDVIKTIGVHNFFPSVHEAVSYCCKTINFDMSEEHANILSTSSGGNNNVFLKRNNSFKDDMGRSNVNGST